MKTNIEELIESADKFCNSLELSINSEIDHLNTLTMQLDYCMKEAKKIADELRIIKSYKELGE